MIGRNLAGTSDKGTIISCPTTFGLQSFSDSDFAGLFKRDPDHSPSSSKSRSGYIIKFCGCPLLWKSKLQPTIALSTSEAEYYSLSQLMRALIPICSLLKNFFSIVIPPERFMTLARHIPCVVLVDNTSALSLARDQQVTARTRHYHFRYHFFWSNIGTRGLRISVEYVSTDEQDADFLTKGVPRLPFECNRIVCRVGDILVNRLASEGRVKNDPKTFDLPRLELIKFVGRR